MLTKVQKWGNSLGLRIPRSVASEARVAAGSTVIIALERGGFMVRAVRHPRHRLDDLLKQITNENIHDEIVTGAPVGREAL
jgi:antitoxin MazE